jgi:hypothetical protein
LTVKITEGSGCIDLAAGTSRLVVSYEITGGTGRFKDASGNLNYTATMRAIFRNEANAPAFLTLTGEIEGTLKGDTSEE